MGARIGLIALLLALAMAAACFTLSFQNGTIRCSSDPKRACPTGYSCFDDYCWLRNPDASAGNVDGGTD
jgi:hypothetical protein